MKILEIFAWTFGIGLEIWFVLWFGSRPVKIETKKAQDNTLELNKDI